MDCLRRSGLAVDLFDPVAEMPLVQHFKLVLNLGNALNALAGKPLAVCLRSAAYRNILAAMWREGLTVCKLEGMDFLLQTGRLFGFYSWRKEVRTACAVDSKPISLVFFVMALPNVLYWPIARILRATDDTYKSSMLVDLLCGPAIKHVIYSVGPDNSLTGTI